MTGNIKHKFVSAGEKAGRGAEFAAAGREAAGGGVRNRRARQPAGAAVARLEHSVFKVNFMVKLLRACVWMPWRKQARKDVASYDKPRGVASTL